MKSFVFLLIFLTLNPLVSEESFILRTSSKINWGKESNNQNWMNFRQWKIGQNLKDNAPQWKRTLFENTVIEKVGKVLQCIGTCKIYRGMFSHQIQYLSNVFEKDEIQTGEGSYLWVFLFDGTMLRLSPNTSITLREINIGKKSVLYHARLNLGHIFWHHRPRLELVKKKFSETDLLFLPLELKSANLILLKSKKSFDNKINFLDSREISLVERQYERLNTLILHNNKILNKKSKLYLTTKNGGIYSEDSTFHAIASKGKDLFINKDNLQFLGYKENLRENIQKDLKYFYLGYYGNIENLEKDFWYKIVGSEREVSKMRSQYFYTLNFLVKRIPTILVAREMLLKKSIEMFDEKITRNKLAKEFNYRLWTEEEIEKKLKFLQDYNRRIETENLFLTRKELNIDKNEDSIKDFNLIKEIKSFYKKSLKKYILR